MSTLDPSILARLNAGEGALNTKNPAITDPNILARLNGATETEETKEAEPWYEDLGEGLGVSGLSTYYGIKDLIVGMDDEDRATLEDWKQDAGESGWGTAGEVVGDIAQIALPAGGLLKGAKAANTAVNAMKAGRLTKTLQGASKALPLVADLTASAGVAGLKATDEGETRLGNMKEDLLGGLGGAAVGKVLKKAAKGADLKDGAKRILDAGGYLTPDKAAKSKMIQGVGGIMTVIPTAARAAEVAKDKALSSWNKLMLDSVRDNGAEIGRKGFIPLKEGINKAYDNAWSGATTVSNNAKVKFVNTLTDSFDELSEADGAVLKSLGKDFKKLTTKPDGAKMKALDNAIRKRIKAAGSPESMQLRDTLKELRVNLREGLPDDVMAKLKDVDKDYAKYLTLRKATAAARDTEGVFRPKQASQASATVGGETATATGKAPLQQLIADGVDTIDMKDAGKPIEIARRLFAKFPSILPYETMGNLVIGNTSPQKALVKITDELRKKGVSTTAIGAALTGTESGE